MSESLSLQICYTLKWIYIIYFIRHSEKYIDLTSEPRLPLPTVWVYICYFVCHLNYFDWWVSKIGFLCVNNNALFLLFGSLWENWLWGDMGKTSMCLYDLCCHLGALLWQMVGTTFLQATSKLIFLYAICQCLSFWCSRCPAVIKVLVHVSMHFLCFLFRTEFIVDALSSFIKTLNRYWVN